MQEPSTENTGDNARPAKKTSTLRQLGLWAAFIAVAGGVGYGDYAFNKAQQVEPAYAAAMAQGQAEKMGYMNLRLESFNQVSQKSAHITFGADKPALGGQGTLHYKGEADCSTMSCTGMKIALDKNNPYTPGV
ncbi:MAG: hypothetical protein GC185_06605 [Alphaproteobacteria bacterium]|nr:hypothetical protein [Alphaproteobacteria bacterium]